MKLKKILLSSVLASLFFVGTSQKTFASSTYWSKYGNDWYLYEDDVLVTNSWYKDLSNNWYWLNSEGDMATGWKKINDIWYFFSKDGVMQVDWIFTDENWYYMDNNGGMKTGWVFTSGNWYYMSGSGEMQRGVIQDSSYNYYYLAQSGEMKKGIFVVQGLKKSTTSSGAIIDPSGLVATNTISYTSFVKNALNKSLYEDETVGSNDEVSALYSLLDVKAVNKEFINILNEERTRKGLSPVIYDDRLAQGAEFRSRELANQLSIQYKGVKHTRAGSLNKTWSTIYDEELSYLGLNIHQYGYGENIAVNIARQNDRNGYTLSFHNPREIAQLAFDVWKDSPPHYELMILPVKNMYVGLGVAMSSTYFNHGTGEYEDINALFTTLHVLTLGDNVEEN